ncbi:hypothetical protein Pla163_34570 [Planctomycetes bacterium Pla163]|uniref:Uracil-DNA glycosylase n=1 Tax=Rohdeia mirabilis TaxID=2528008 RepID=A0A518D4B4_9BACT|nr:hypothetical protein Pla163_34570 [Planctomycetes bacterium Pla163]
MSQGSASGRGERVTCFGCVHLVTTYQPAFPYACRLMGMKSRALPSIEVFKETGEDCRGYETRSNEARSADARRDGRTG